MALPFDITIKVQQYGGLFGPPMAEFIQENLEYLDTGGGGGAVTSVNGQTGAVELRASSIGASTVGAEVFTIASIAALQILIGLAAVLANPSTLVNAPNDSVAASSGVALWGFYRNGSVLQVRTS